MIRSDNVFLSKVRTKFCFFSFHRSTRAFSPNMETSPLQVKPCKFYLCSALIAIDQWGFCSMIGKCCQLGICYRYLLHIQYTKKNKTWYKPLYMYIWNTSYLNTCIDTFVRIVDRYALSFLKLTYIWWMILRITPVTNMFDGVNLN